MKVGDKVKMREDCTLGVWSGIGRIVHSYLDRNTRVFLVRWQQGHCSRHIEDSLKRVVTL